MIFFMEFPIILILIFIFAVLGINIIPVITWVLTICFIIFLIIGIGSLIGGGAGLALISFLMAAANIALVFFLDGKHLDLWDILTWIF